MDKIGIFRGKPISEMSREDLLTFASWAGKRIAELETLADKHQDLDLNREVLAP